MRKIFLILTFTVINIIFPQDNDSNIPNIKTKIFGINPITLALKIYTGHLGMIINDGANEIDIRFLSWNFFDEIQIDGAGLGYRFYKDKNGKGIFYAGQFSFIKFTDLEKDRETGKKIQSDDYIVLFNHGVEIGYRLIWKNGFTIAPAIGLRYTTNTGDFGNENIYFFDSFPFSGIGFNLKLGLAYMF